MDPCHLCGFDDFRIGCVRTPIGNILPHRSVKQEYILGYDADIAAQRRTGHMTDINAVDADRTAVDFIKPRNQVTDRGLSPAALSDKTQGFLFGNLQVQMTDDHRTVRLMVAVMERDIVEFDFPLQFPGIDRIRRICLKGKIHDFLKPAYAAHTLDDLFIGFHQFLDRSQKHGDIQEICHKITAADLPVEEHPSAEDHNDDIHQIGKQRHSAAEQCEIAVSPAPRIHITAVGTVKFGLFEFNSVIGAGDPHPGNAGLGFAVDCGDFLTVAGKCLHLPFPYENHEQDGKRKTAVDDQRQLSVDTAKHKCAYPQHHTGHEEIFRSVMRHFRHFLQIIGDPAHQGSGLVIIKIGNRKLFDMPEDIPSHIRLHTHAEHMSPVGNDQIQPEFDQIDHQKRNTPAHHHIPVAGRHIFIDHIPHDQRHELIGQSDKKCTDQINHKQIHVRFEISKQSFKHSFLLNSRY